jgi:hypothetical protein
MITEFLDTHRGGLASTLDFKRIAEKHMTKDMDLRDDGRLDWFFDEWVFGADVPTYKLEHKVEPSAEGFVIAGTIRQSNVPENFIMSLPVYADDQLLGRVVVSDEGGDFLFTLPTKPSRVVIDPHSTVLAAVQ